MVDTVNVTTVSSEAAATWLHRWDVQQERYVADREERFTVLCDVVESALEQVPEPVVLDLGCGPGSLAARLHERLPSARIIGIDSDPLLLGLARAHYGERIEWVDADLGGTTWPDAVPRTVHAAVSTTALHWLPTDRLAALYRTLGTLITRGGVLVNGDHLGFGDERMDRLATTVRDRRAARAGVQDNEEWRDWWSGVLADPRVAGLARARAERVGAARAAGEGGQQSHHGNGCTVGDHVELLRSAGFGGVAPLWQVGDDHVLAAVR
ncbi:class I SAM-dependent methyltransferase [Amycolatopsis sp. H20-H5]|uniref:class I SAM-dependent methyltransferase n=1 Tax=Amycolatopsis sp. H20-H5 TaxID=3046309 RepID=UPI002DBE179E|nr:class I SAM-dependent methyltransferase [Amycolatopsis sp. H20-H5]MEC3976396.1 class I SAM-dependent methyltransferase [Amycolatopsis sp. H20-H5]